MHRLIHVRTEEEYEAAGNLFREYAEWLDIDLSFQNFSNELNDLKVMYRAEEGGIILAADNADYVGCIALRKHDKEIAEVKRMYVKSEFQKKGIGSALLTEALLLAVKLSYKTVRLDTLDTMTPAIRLYKAAGFYEIPPYYFNPETNTVYFEKRL